MLAALQLGEIPIPLKGPRTYVHSTDVWNALANLAGDVHAAPAVVIVTFRKLTSKRLRLLPFEQSDRALRFAEIRIAGSILALDECETDITKRIACPESRILPAARLGAATVSIRQPAFASPVEVIVAATKKLHMAQIDAGVKWLVGRLELPMPLAIEPGDEIEIRIGRRLPRLTTVSEVSCNRKLIGAIMFNAIR